MRPISADAIVALDERQKFFHEKILVANAPIARIDIEAATGSGSRDQEFADPLLVPEVLNQVPSARIQKQLLVFSKTVQEIEHRIALRFSRIVTGRKKNAIGNAAPENFARDRAAFGAACGVGGSSEEQAAEQQKRARQSQKRRRDAGAKRTSSVAGTSKRGSSTARPHPVIESRDRRGRKNRGDAPLPSFVRAGRMTAKGYAAL